MHQGSACRPGGIVFVPGARLGRPPALDVLLYVLFLGGDEEKEGPRFEQE